MLTKLQTYLEERWIKKLLKRSSAELSSAELSFDEIRDKYTKRKKGSRKLLVYCILLVSGDRSISRPGERLNKVLREYLDALELAIELKSLEAVILIQERRFQTELAE
jgi:hypothetical protein